MTETLPVQTRGLAGVHRLSGRGRQSHIPQEIGILCPELPRSQGAGGSQVPALSRFCSILAAHILTALLH